MSKKQKKQSLKELPKLLKIAPSVVKENWWRRTHLRALKPGLIVVVHKNQAQVSSVHVRVRYGQNKANIVVLPTQFFKTLQGKEFSK